MVDLIGRTRRGDAERGNCSALAERSRNEGPSVEVSCKAGGGLPSQLLVGREGNRRVLEVRSKIWRNDFGWAGDLTRDSSVSQPCVVKGASLAYMCGVLAAANASDFGRSQTLDSGTLTTTYHNFLHHNIDTFNSSPAEFNILIFSLT